MFLNIPHSTLVSCFFKDSLGKMKRTLLNGKGGNGSAIWRQKCFLSFFLESFKKKSDLAGLLTYSRSPQSSHEEYFHTVTFSFGGCSMSWSLQQRDCSGLAPDSLLTSTRLISATLRSANPCLMDDQIGCKNTNNIPFRNRIPQI